jgi:hypothetical protein
MATITSFGFLRHVRGEPVAHLLFFKDGRLRRSGRGPALFDGVLARHAPEAAGDLMEMVASGGGRIEARTMVEARTPDGQRVVGLNDRGAAGRRRAPGAHLGDERRRRRLW